MSILQLSGAIPPMITPFTPEGTLDTTAHIRNLERWQTTGLGGFLVLGSNSEAAFLSDAEKLELIRTTRQTVTDLPVLVGTGLESTLRTIQLTNEAAAIGADAALILTPHFYRSAISEAAMIKHFEVVANQSAIPILIYNVPKYTSTNLSVEVIRTLSQHPNIIGMKDSTGNMAQLVLYKKAVQADFQILVGTASAWYLALDLGVKAGIMALANCAPSECVQLQQLMAEGKREEARALHHQLVPANTAVTAQFGIAGLKYACMLRGFEGGHVRGPLSELTEQERRTVERIFQEAGLLY